MTAIYRLLLPGLMACSALAANSAMAQTPDPPKPACAILLGGATPKTAKDEVNKVWLEANLAVSGSAAESLNDRGYVVHPGFVDKESADERLQVAAQRMAETKCPEAIEISIQLEPPTGKPELIVFKALVFHLVRQSPETVTVVGDYSKEYSYPMTKETLDSLSMSGVGRRFADDIAIAGVIAQKK